MTKLTKNLNGYYQLSDQDLFVLDMDGVVSYQNRLGNSVLYLCIDTIRNTCVEIEWTGRWCFVPKDYIPAVERNIGRSLNIQDSDVELVKKHIERLL